MCPAPDSRNPFKAKARRSIWACLFNRLQEKTNSRRWALGPAAQPVGAKAKVRLKDVNMAEADTLYLNLTLTIQTEWNN